MKLHLSLSETTSSHGALAVFLAGKLDLVIIDYLVPGMKGDKLAAAVKAPALQ